MRFFKKIKKNGWVVLKNSGEQLTYALLHAGDDKPVVADYFSRTMDLDNETVVKPFSEEFALASRHCVALLNRGEYQILMTEAVDVPPEEVKQAVKWNIKDMLDFPVINATVDVLNIPQDLESQSRRRFMLAVVAKNEVVRERIVRFIDNAGIGLEAIDIPEIAQRNVAARLEEEGRGLALLSFNDEGGILTLTAQGELFHSLQLNITVEQLQAEEEFERTGYYERIALDLQRTLDNFDRQFSYVVINRLLVAPFAMRNALVEYLSPYLSVRVQTFELNEVFDYEQMRELGDIDLQANALHILGAGLRDEG